VRLEPTTGPESKEKVQKCGDVTKEYRSQFQTVPSLQVSHHPNIKKNPKENDSIRL
jgi:hypothetical protein